MSSLLGWLCRHYQSAYAVIIGSIYVSIIRRVKSSLAGRSAFLRQHVLVPNLGGTELGAQVKFKEISGLLQLQHTTTWPSGRLSSRDLHVVGATLTWVGQYPVCVRVTV